MIIRLYAALLRLYPRHFRAEFAEEMQAVFAEAIAGAARRDTASLAKGGGYLVHKVERHSSPKTNDVFPLGELHQPDNLEI